MTLQFEMVRSLALTLLRAEPQQTLTREKIGAVVDLAISTRPELFNLVDRAAVVKDLETRFAVRIGRSLTLDDPTDHKPWLPERRGAIEWRYWERYRELLAQSWPPASLAALHEVTDDVLSRLEDPKRPGAWDRRGLVVGHVQSGKTASYTGLICKAADAGYKLVVVLAGVHKSLRSQTQVRLDEGFLGYESVAAVAQNQGLRVVGVGQIDPSVRPNSITNRSDDGDFKRSVAERFQINPGDTPLLFVIKKNASVLKNLLEWVEWAANSHDEKTGRPIVTGVPLLVIDDEADNASVDTKEQAFDEDGNPDPDHDPTVINRRIRRLLHCFEKVAYVGYTATPFANVFIHESGRTSDEGEDLFPRSFILNLKASTDYVGPVKVFGLESKGGDASGARGLSIVRHIDDHFSFEDVFDEIQAGPVATGWMPPQHKKSHLPRIDGTDAIPGSLKEAIHAFLLACAARRVRGQSPAHNSMLVHVTRFTDVQAEVERQVKAYLADVERRLRYGDGQSPDRLTDRLAALWRDDFMPRTREIDPAQREIPWAEIAPHISATVKAIQVKRINGKAPDVLDYDRHRETGLSVIAVGGDKLARGLTLEGLTVSYFLRASRMYDTLMQMGRWFGYRPGYLDLCRMYMTEDLEHWFRHITVANEELRLEFDRMVAGGATPREYGLRVMSHPSLLITSRVKMRHGTELDLSFGGSIAETTVFASDEKTIESNLAAVDDLVRLCGPGFVENPEREIDGSRQAWVGTRLWQEIAPDKVCGFLRRISTHELARKVNGGLMAQFIERQVAVGELTQWSVALVGRERKPDEAGEHTWGLPSLATLVTGRPERRLGDQVGLIDRRGTLREEGAGRFTIQRLLNPRDEGIDLSPSEYHQALAATVADWKADLPDGADDASPTDPKNPMMREARPVARGLLLLYLLDPSAIGGPVRKPLVGFAVSFPATRSAVRVKYRVNNVYWAQELGAAA